MSTSSIICTLTEDLVRTIKGFPQEVATMVRNGPVTRRMGCCNSKSKKKFNFLARIQLSELDNSGNSDTDSSDRDEEAAANDVVPIRALEAGNMGEREGHIVAENNVVQAEAPVQNREFLENINEQEAEDYQVRPDGDDDSNNMNDTIPMVPTEERNDSDSDGSIRLPRNENPSQLSIPRTPFNRVCREIFQHYKPGCRVQKKAYEALQEAAEYYMAGVFRDAYKITVVRKKVTLQPQDLKVALEIRGDLNLIPIPAAPSPRTNSRRFSHRSRRMCNSL